MRLKAAAIVLVLAVLTAGAAGAATAGPADDAEAVASSFLDALAVGDGAGACSQVTPDLLAKLGGSTGCKLAFAPDASAVDDDAQATLFLAFEGARAVARQHGNAFTAPRFTLKDLAGAIEKRIAAIDVRLAGGPLAARGQLATTAFLDRRSNRRRVVFYAEADSGDIVRLSGTVKGVVDVAVVARGVPEAGAAPAQPAASFTFTFGDEFASADGTVMLDVLLQSTGTTAGGSSSLLIRLIPVNGRYLVDDLFASVADVGGG